MIIIHPMCLRLLYNQWVYDYYIPNEFAIIIYPMCFTIIIYIYMILGHFPPGISPLVNSPHPGHFLPGHFPHLVHMPPGTFPPW